MMRNKKGEGRERPSHHNYVNERGDKFYGFDTETPLGELGVIASNVEVREAKTFNEVLRFFAQKKYASSVFFTFNLRFDVEAILKTTNDLDFLKLLYFEGAAPKGVQWSDKTTIRYIPTKFLRICFKAGKNSQCASLFDIAQFYGGWNLEKASQKFLGKGKNPCSGKRIGNEKGYYERHKEEILEYCRNDAELTLEIAMLMKRTIESVKMPKGSLTFRNPISQAKISEMYVKDNFTYPKIPEKLEFYHWLSEQAYHGGIFSTEKRGVFNRPLYSYDINSAYPYEMDKLPHWANGRFVKVKKPDELNTRYGWFLCEFNCDKISYPDYSHPYNVEFCYKEVSPDHCENVMLNPRRVVYPTGTRKQWVTKIEYEWMLNNDYMIDFIGGFVWEQTKHEHTSPFSWVKDVYYARQKIKSEDEEDIRQWALKIAMNGFYGKTAQKRKGTGVLTNFFYASYITAGTRLKISSVGLLKPDHVIEYATDSILLDSPLDLSISDKLGEWSFKKYEKGLIIGSGIRQQWNKDGTFTTHARGLTYKSDWNMLKEITEGYNRKERKINIECDYLYFEKERPIHLGEVIFHHKILGLEDLGVFMRVSKKLDLHTDKKRRWFKTYKTWKEFLESPPENSLPLRLGMEL